MDQLSQSQKTLIQCLKHFKMSDEAILGTMLILKTDDQIADMAKFLENHPNATQSDILTMALEIYKKEQ